MPRFILLVMMFLLITAACGNENGEEDNDTSEEMTDDTQDEEPTEMDEASEEDEVEGNDESEEVDESEESNVEEELTETDSEDETSENVEEEENAAEATVFDINDSATQEILLAATYPEEGMAFQQDVITEGMTQAEVEEQYGDYDFICPGHGRAVTIYNNLGVVYSVPGPYGEEEPATTDVDSNDVTVENVMYYSGDTYDDVTSALGPPNVDAYEPEEGPVSGYHFMEYELDEGEETELVGVFWMHENENGQLMVDVMTKDEQPKDADKTADQTENETAGQMDDEVQEMLTAFIEAYLSSLEDYYNDENGEVFDYTEPTSENGVTIAGNKESGDFQDHENHDIEILEMEDGDSSIYYVTVAREYSHATSGGRYITTVEYEVINTPQGFKVGSFEEIDNQPAD